MSVEGARQLLQQLAEDSEFEQVMKRGGTREERISAIIEAANRRGLEVSADDIDTLIEEATGGEDGSLSDEQLTQVAGGAWYSPIMEWLLPQNWDSNGGGGGVRG